jgi:hypothetical protein
LYTGKLKPSFWDQAAGVRAFVHGHRRKEDGRKFGGCGLHHARYGRAVAALGGDHGEDRRPPRRSSQDILAIDE